MREWLFKLLVTINCCAAASVGILFYAFRVTANRVTNQTILIQQQRAEGILRNCMDQNQRHRSTIATLDSVIAQLPKSQRAQAIKNRNFTVLLIDALAPLQDCQRLVRISTQITTKP